MTVGGSPDQEQTRVQVADAPMRADGHVASLEFLVRSHEEHGSVVPVGVAGWGVGRHVDEVGDHHQAILRNRADVSRANVARHRNELVDAPNQPRHCGHEARRQ